MSEDKLDLILQKLEKLDTEYQNAVIEREGIRNDLAKTKKILHKELTQNKLDLFEGLEYIGEKLRDVLLLVLVIGAAYGAYNTLEHEQRAKIANDYLNTFLGAGGVTVVIYRLFKNKEEKEQSKEKIKTITEAKDEDEDEDEV